MGVDIDLAVEMISAACPNCTIYFVEANSSADSDLQEAETEAVALGAHIVSNGFADTGLDQSHFNAKGVTYLGAAGDGGSGVAEPAAFPSVVAVGGCTTFVRPRWQHDKTCAFRLANDVSAVADPSTGVAEYDSYDYSGWIVVGGTSVPTPLLSSVFGLAENANKQNGGRTFWQTAHHQFLYRLKSRGKLVRYATGGGWGSPDGIGAF